MSPEQFFLENISKNCNSLYVALRVLCTLYAQLERVSI
ncbi:hypothetical protein CEV32_0240 [Brucella rhizosphaerae]|uniref:Uncharacterized protein n=1 Tax=Brucella rhizosphaerae TaxID=571254 RepID=A0A256FHA6_9HYPH|nr:hypothetical protein CEV32_0240 [Brucella rhizosphaerae]